MNCIYCGTSTSDPDKAVCDDCEETETAPLDLKLACAFAGLGGILAVVSTFRLLGESTPWTVTALSLVLLALIQVAAIYGMFHIERWAWPIGLVVFGAVAAVAVGRVVAGDLYAVLEAIVALAVGGYLYTQRHIYYPSALRWFGS